jgi:predicted DNA-binding transcriptional regulator AlpA
MSPTTPHSPDDDHRTMPILESQRMVTASQLPDLLQSLIGRRPSRMTIHRWTKAKQFPATVSLGPRFVAWRVADVLAWVEQRGKKP